MLKTPRTMINYYSVWVSKGQYKRDLILLHIWKCLAYMDCFKNIRKTDYHTFFPSTLENDFSYLVNFKTTNRKYSW